MVMWLCHLNIFIANCVQRFLMSLSIYSVVGFRGPLQNHMILGISCSCTGSIDVFS